MPTMEQDGTADQDPLGRNSLPLKVSRLRSKLSLKALSLIATGAAEVSVLRLV